MIINNADPKKFVTDYELSFVGGSRLEVTVDYEAGDTLEKGETLIKINLVPKEILGDSGNKQPAEYIEVYRTHLLAMREVTREVQPLTPEEKYQWNMTLKELAGVH